ncbi:MAG: SDR family oxidoreductase [Chloroflexi bacterium]|nr:SDR family oxidoreductase [Chloroflexota bacterium]
MADGTALITGASSGIGLELAREFARHRHDVVLVARNQAALTVLAEDLRQKTGVAATVLPFDLSDPKAPAALFDALSRQGVIVDWLVNNAGFATYGLFTEPDTARDLEMVQVNVVALTHLAKLFAPRMKARGRGGILNVASTAAFQPGPLMAVYYATKAYVLSFSEALANELRGTGVTVTALCPGPARTGFQEQAKMEDSRLVAGEIMDARTVARAGYAGLMKGKTLVIPGRRNQLGALATRFVPRSMAARLVRRLQERVEAR